MSKTLHDILPFIPAEIADLAGLTLSEKFLLAYVATHPFASNHCLAQLLGLTERSVTNLLRRLQDGGLLQIRGKGRARCCMASHVEHRKNFQDAEFGNQPTIC